MQCAVAVCPGFTVREEMKPAYNDIVHWAVMDYDGNLDPDKGLLIWGDIGTGKSTMLKIIRSSAPL
jgi:ABC-type bacteriocin/lantibiotic exporter with double-glycine peptidase domain